MTRPTRRVEFCPWCCRAVEDHRDTGMKLAGSKVVICEMAPRDSWGSHGIAVDVPVVLDQFGQPATERP